MQLPSPEPAPAVASTDETTRLILENMRLQATFSGFMQENEGLQSELEECHRKLKELHGRPIVQAEEVESPAVQAEALEPEPQMEDTKTKGWVIIKAADSFPGQNSVIETSVEGGRDKVKQTDGGFCWRHVPTVASSGRAFLRADKTPTEMVNAVQPGMAGHGQWDEVHIKPGATISSIRRKIQENYVIVFEDPIDEANAHLSLGGGYMKSKRRKKKTKRRKKKSKRRKKKTKRRKKTKNKKERE